MLRIDGRVLVGSVVGLFLVGAALGFLVGGGFGSPDPADDGAPAQPADDGAPAQPADDGAPALTPTPTHTATATATASPTSTPTPTPVPTPTVTPRSEKRTPSRILIRRFDRGEIRRHLERLLDDWRGRKGLNPYTTRGNVFRELRSMARNHSVEMADAGEVAHTIDGRSSLDRYERRKLDQTCKFERHNETWLVTPEDEQLELIGKTYAGRTYVDNGTRKFNEDERAVAQAIFDDWLSRYPFRYRLQYRNTTHVGIGVETTRDNEVYVTANLCGVGPRNNSYGPP